MAMEKNDITVQDILGQDGLLARHLKEFEFRSSQMEMALLVHSAIREKKHAIVEAGTGTGKTFGYMVPVILSGKKTVISTGTKNLQEQIYFKDIPLLEKATGLSIDAMIMKGRRNYLCLHRYHQYFAQASLIKNETGKIRKRLEDWIATTEYADRAELTWLADDDILWDALSCPSEQCLGAKCMHLDECFLGRLRSEAARCRLIIVNHHLFFADMKVKRSGFGEIIPRFQVAVFDEAHSLEDIATAYLGESISTTQITELVLDLEKELKQAEEGTIKGVKNHLGTLRTGAETIRMFFNDGEDKGGLDPGVIATIKEGPGLRIREALKSIAEKLEAEEGGAPAFQSLLNRVAGLAHSLDQILSEREANWFRWYERRKKGVTLFASPLDISDRMKELLFDKVKTVVLTSATLSTGGTFDYIRSRLGLPEHALEGICPSHFDFKTQTLMYIPRDLAQPGKATFGPEIARRILEILERSKGRALVLFTSYHNLNLVHRMLEGNIPYPIYRQGDAPRSALLESFRNDIHSVLLATSAFWQGVDVPGEALSCLIIDKLPFDSPGEPLVAARIEAIRDRGGNPFMEYQLPSAIISLKQGLGRLVRKGTDRGILSILDVRIMTSRYGKFFLESLPRIPLTHELSDINRFFEKEKSHAPQALEGHIKC